MATSIGNESVGLFHTNMTNVSTVFESETLFSHSLIPALTVCYLLAIWTIVIHGILLLVFISNRHKQWIQKWKGIISLVFTDFLSGWGYLAFLLAQNFPNMDFYPCILPTGFYMATQLSTSFHILRICIYRLVSVVKKGRMEPESTQSAVIQYYGILILSILISSSNFLWLKKKDSYALCVLSELAGPEFRNACIFILCILGTPCLLTTTVYFILICVINWKAKKVNPHPNESNRSLPANQLNNSYGRTRISEDQPHNSNGISRIPGNHPNNSSGRTRIPEDQPHNSNGISRIPGNHPNNSSGRTRIPEDQPHNSNGISRIPGNHPNNSYGRTRKPEDQPHNSNGSSRIPGKHPNNSNGRARVTHSFNGTTNIPENQPCTFNGRSRLQEKQPNAATSVIHGNRQAAGKIAASPPQGVESNVVVNITIRKHYKKIMSTIGLMLLFNNLAVLPYCATLLYTIVQERLVIAPNHIWAAAAVMLQMNSALSPFIYCLKVKPVNEAFKSMFTCRE